MIAAAKCPSCGHLFELRDGFGDLVPLAYCDSCESYYPESVGACRWCGTKPARPPIGPRVWYGAGAGLAAVIAALWVAQNRTSKAPAKAAPQTVATTSPTAPLDADTTTARLVVAASDSLLRAMSVADSTRSGEEPAVVASAPGVAIDSPPTSLAASPSVRAPAKAVAQSSKPARRAPRWVRSVSRHWVIVRSGASRDARIVASIGPNSRVELGEARGDWRRIRAKGITGWVEPRSSFELVASR